MKITKNKIRKIIKEEVEKFKNINIDSFSGLEEVPFNPKNYYTISKSGSKIYISDYLIDKIVIAISQVGIGNISFINARDDFHRALFVKCIDLFNIFCKEISNSRPPRDLTIFHESDPVLGNIATHNYSILWVIVIALKNDDPTGFYYGKYK